MNKELDLYYTGSNNSKYEIKDEDEISIEVYQVLYELVFLCYDKMMKYKDAKIERIVNNLKKETVNITDDTKDKIWLIVQPLLQQEWSIFVNNNYRKSNNKYNNSSFKSKNRKKQIKQEPKVDVAIMTKHIDDIYKKIKEKFSFINDVLEFSPEKVCKYIPIHVLILMSFNIKYIRMILNYILKNILVIAVKYVG